MIRALVRAGLAQPIIRPFYISVHVLYFVTKLVIVTKVTWEAHIAAIISFKAEHALTTQVINIFTC